MANKLTLTSINEVISVRIRGYYDPCYNLDTQPMVLANESIKPTLHEPRATP